MVSKPAFLALAALLACAACAACTTREQRAQVAPAPASIATPEEAKFGFFFVDEGGNAKLAYGQANSDNVGLMMECAKGSRTVAVSGVAGPRPSPTLTLASDGAKADLKATTQNGEMSIVRAQAPLTAPVLANFRKSGAIQVAYAGRTITLAAKPNEKVALEQFFSACDGRPA
jgi:hypothetical protein